MAELIDQPKCGAADDTSCHVSYGSERCAAITAPSGPASRDLTKINSVGCDDKCNTFPKTLSVDGNLKIRSQQLDCCNAALAVLH